MSAGKLSHFDAAGHAHMVDVSDKPESRRMARAEGLILMAPEVLGVILAGTAGKGDVLGVARLAGIMAAKRTADLIPLCHPLPLSKVALEFEPDPARSAIRATAMVRTTGPTGVEMEALTAVSVALLTIYDMVKAMGKDMRIEGIRLLEKEGGKSGHYTAPEAGA